MSEPKEGSETAAIDEAEVRRVVNESLQLSTAQWKTSAERRRALLSEAAGLLSEAMAHSSYESGPLRGARAESLLAALAEELSKP